MWEILNVTHVTVCCNISAVCVCVCVEETKPSEVQVLCTRFHITDNRLCSDIFVAGNHNVAIFINKSSYNGNLSCQETAANSAYYSDVTQIAEAIALTGKISCLHSCRTKISYNTYAYPVGMSDIPIDGFGIIDECLSHICDSPVHIRRIYRVLRN